MLHVGRQKQPLPRQVARNQARTISGLLREDSPEPVLGHVNSKRKEEKRER